MLSKNAKRPKRSKRRKVSALLCSILLISAIAGAAIVAPVPVFALSAGGIKGTIASIVLSLLLQTGTAPTNIEWLNQLNAAYGVESSIGTIEQCITDGLLTQTAEGLIDTGLSAAIEAAPEYTSLGLSELFSTTAADAGVTVASGAANLATTAINVGTLGTIGAFAGAAAVGVGVGVLINHVYNRFKNPIKYSIPIDQVNAINQQYATNGQYIIKKSPNPNYADGFYSFNMGIAIAFYNNGKSIYYKNVSDTNQTYYNRSWGLIEQNPVHENTAYPGQSGKINQSDQLIPNTPAFNDQYAAKQYLDNLTYDQYKNNLQKSPDLISPLGNQYYDRDNDTIPGISNIVPDGYDMSPVDVDDYLEFADNANNNTNNGDTGQEIQGEAFDDFVDPYLIPEQQQPDQPIIPDNPDIPTPEYPDRPLTPDQPIVPDKPDATPEDITDMTDMMTTPELKSVFPFCIPWDLYNLFLIFDTGENRRAPHIVFTFPGTDWHIDVDLAQFDPVAALLRLLELIAFIAGLAVATRALIGATG